MAGKRTAKDIVTTFQSACGVFLDAQQEEWLIDAIEAALPAPAKVTPLDNLGLPMTAPNADWSDVSGVLVERTMTRAEAERLYPEASWTNEHRRMSAYLGCNPHQPDTWPMEILDRLIAVEKEKGKEGLMTEVNKLNGN